MKKMTSNNNVSDEVLEDIFHDAILVLYEKIRDGKFELKASFQTYLNSVCRYSLLNVFKKKDKEPDFLDDKKLKKIEYDDSITDTLDLIPEFNSPKMTALVKALNTLKENSKKCFELMEMFWFEKMSMNRIADKLGYSNAASAKNQKAKCQKRLKKLAFKLIEE
jgi:RNA polymerase sigma factor (sigma-70 family)